MVAFNLWSIVYRSCLSLQIIIWLNFVIQSNYQKNWMKMKILKQKINYISYEDLGGLN
jgi:hypothetical protein